MTVALEYLGDGSPADRNFQALAQLVLDTGGRSVGIRWGTSSMTWSASTDSGPKTITHGLGKTPALAAAFNADTTGSYAGIASFVCPTFSFTTTTFDVYGRTPSALTGTKAIFWVVIG